MNYKSKSAKVCHAMYHLFLKVAFHESAYLYGLIGMCATCATYLIKLFNRYITAPVGHGVMEAISLNSLTKLGNLAAQVVRAAQITRHKGDI